MLAVYFNMLASAIGKLYCLLVIVYGEHCVQTEKKNTHFSACFSFPFVGNVLHKLSCTSVLIQI